MQLRAFFSQFQLEAIKLGPAGATVELSFNQADRNAAWELYIEMLTRIATQPLPTEAGDEKTALDSVYSLFGITRQILKRHGPGTIEFSKVAIPVLNQVVRPFTAKWHKKSLEGALDQESQRAAFRSELQMLQRSLRKYNALLAHVAGVEDLTDLEESE